MNGEFKYEKEIRLDEERIARYFDNLALFIDLPGENEAVFERIGRIGNEKICNCRSPENLRYLSPAWNFEENEESDEDGSREDNIHPSGYEIPELLDGVAVRFAEFFAGTDDAARNAECLNIICQCGKTLARVSDMFFAAETETGLKTALAKRSLRDLNDLAKMIIDFGEQEAIQQLDVLQIIRKKLLDILFNLEKN